MRAKSDDTLELATDTGKVIEADSNLNKLNLKPGERVLLLGGYGVNNIGDEAILAGLIKKLPGDIQLQVVSRTPQETAALHGIKAISPLKSLTALMRCDVLIVGGGGMFSRHMGLMARFIPLFGLIAKSRKARVAFHGVGVYPSTPKWVQRMIRWLAPHLTFFTVRDAMSACTLNSWGVEAQQIPDLSIYMPAANSGKGEEIILSLGLEVDVPTVALCLTSTERQNEAKIMDAVPRLINAMPDVQFCFVPISRHPKVPHHNDLLLAERIQHRAPRMAVLRTVHHPSEILAMFNHFNAVICMRYHSLLFTQRSGAGVIPIPYAEKCQSWLEEHCILPVELDDVAIETRLRREMVCRR